MRLFGLWPLTRLTRLIRLPSLSASHATHLIPLAPLAALTSLTPLVRLTPRPRHSSSTIMSAAAQDTQTASPTFRFSAVSRVVF